MSSREYSVTELLEAAGHRSRGPRQAGCPHQSYLALLNQIQQILLNWLVPSSLAKVGVVCLLSLAAAAGGLAVVVFSFTGLEPSHRCRVAGCEEEDWPGLVTPPPDQVPPRCRALAPQHNASRECRAVVWAGGMCDTTDLLLDHTLMTSTLVEDFKGPL